MCKRDRLGGANLAALLPRAADTMELAVIRGGARDPRAIGGGGGAPSSQMDKWLAVAAEAGVVAAVTGTVARTSSVLSPTHLRRCRRSTPWRSRWSPSY